MTADGAPPALHGAVTLEWADGSYRFRLAVAQLVELQDLCGAGPYAIYLRLVAHQWRVQDLRETIRLGLIGGGTAPGEALRLVRAYVEARPLLECEPVAARILAAALIGPDLDDEDGEDPDPGKATAPEAGSTTAP